LKLFQIHDIVGGGFPCQDYSVATTLKKPLKGLIGKKGGLLGGAIEAY